MIKFLLLIILVNIIYCFIFYGIITFIENHTLETEKFNKKKKEKE